MENALENVERIVIKIGSSLLVDGQTGLRYTWLNSIADDLLKLTEQGKQPVIVSSGAIAIGRSLLGLDGSKGQKGQNERRLSLSEKQAAAAVGQIELCRVYREVLSHRGLTCGQILVTLDDTEQRDRYLNARATVQSLLKCGIVPVVNENDTVGTAEIRFGDNDRLSARVATMISADLLIILSDVDGLYTGDPANSDSELVKIVETITPEIEQMAGGASSKIGTGGMVTKIEAAKISTQAGTDMVITSGLELNPIRRLLDGAPHTRFPALGNPVSARKRWIASDLSEKGWLVIDAGAVRAIDAGKSLLPVGVSAVGGEFKRGDVIEVRTEAGEALAWGLSAYDKIEAEIIAGQKADQIFSLLGYLGPENLVHRDDMVLLSKIEKRQS